MRESVIVDYNGERLEITADYEPVIPATFEDPSEGGDVEIQKVIWLKGGRGIGVTDLLMSVTGKNYDMFQELKDLFWEALDECQTVKVRRGR